MKRTNGFVLGSILVVLIGGVVVIQTLNQAGTGQDHDHNPQQAAAQGPPPKPSEPSLDELNQAVAPKQQGPTNMAGQIPDNEKFRPADNSSTLPSSMWYRGSRTPQSEEEWRGQSRPGDD